MSTKNLNERIDEFYENLITLVYENKLDQKLEYIVAPNIKDSEKLGQKVLKLDSLITSKQFFKKWLYRNIKSEEHLLEIEKQIFKEI